MLIIGFCIEINTFVLQFCYLLVRHCAECVLSDDEQGAAMGRVIQREVVALRCELRSCESLLRLLPVSLYAPWHLHRKQLLEAIELGWALVLTPQLRSYCPQHATRALACSCRTNPDRVHLCVVHAPDTAKLLWSRQSDAPMGDPDVICFYEATGRVVGRVAGRAAGRAAAA